MSISRLIFIIVVTSCAVALGQVGDAESSIEGREVVEPADVYARVSLLRAELEFIRHQMGSPSNRQAEIEVSDAAPREVFFQALTLFRKADRLCFEQARQRAAVPKTPGGVIQPRHVRGVVMHALERVRRVKEELGIDENANVSARDPNKTPTDVFKAIVQANRQINLMLDHRFSPSDVYQQVTLAISYASRLLVQFPGAARIPATPDFEPGKQPSDVYQRLVDCFDQIRDIAELSEVKVLELDVGGEHLAEVTPSDVYDIASLLVSELAFLHNLSKDTQSPHDLYYPGRKFPSHVYQRVGILEAQLSALQDRVSRVPEWLGARPGGQ